MRIPVSSQADPFVGLAFTVWERFFQHLYPRLARRGLLDDWRQEAVVIAYSVSQKKLSPTSKRALSEIYKGWYRFLREYGYAKTKEGRWELRP